MTVTTRTPEKDLAFLTVLADTCSVTKACEAIRSPRNVVYGWRNKDPEFAAAWDEARQLGADALEDEALRRAHEGVDEPVFYKGIRSSEAVRKYSDTLMIFLLKGFKPEKYKERIASEHSGAIGTVHADVSDEDAATKLAAILNAASARLDRGEDLA